MALQQGKHTATLVQSLTRCPENSWALVLQDACIAMLQVVTNGGAMRR